MLLLPAFKQKVKCEQPTVRNVQSWDAGNIDTLQGCLECTDWTIFKDSTTSLDEYADSVTSYVKFCVDTCIPVRSIRSYSNQKPWVNNDVRIKLRERTIAFKSGDAERYKQTSEEVYQSCKETLHGQTGAQLQRL